MSALGRQDLVHLLPIGSVAPPSRRTDIARTELVERCEGFGGRVILMSAPSGYGKTTLAAQVCTGERRPTLWHTAVPGDNDPVAFASSLLAALAVIEPLDHDSVAALTGPAGRLDTVLLPVLERCCRSRTFVAVIDDAHHLSDPESQLVLRRFVVAAGHASLVIIPTRSDPDIGLSKLRARGDLLELRAADLAFDERAASLLFERLAGRSDPDLVTEVHRRAEGWPAAVAISALSARSRSARSRISGRHRDIADYFSEEVFNELSPSTLSFLWSTSPLTRLNPDICDHVLERCDSHQMLDELDHRNLFVVPIDADRSWYRYHRLFHDLLVEQQRRFAPDLDVPRLLTRAAHWLRSRGNVAEAFRYAQRAGDNRLAGEIALAAAERYNSLGQTETLRLWAERSTDDEIRSDPAYAIVAAFAYGHHGDTRRADRYLDAAAHGDLDRASPAGAASLETHLYLVRTVFGSAGPDQMLRDGRRIYELERDSNSRWLIGAHRAVGCAHLMRGEPRLAIDALDRAISLSRHLPETVYVRIYCLGYLVSALLDVGDLEQARLHLDEVTTLMTGAPWERSLEGLPVHVATASLHAVQGDSDRARVALTRVNDLLAAASPLTAADAAVRGAEVALAIGDNGRFEGLRQVARRSLDLLNDAGAVRARFDRLGGGANMCELLRTLTPAEHRVLSHLSSHRTLAEIAGDLYVSRSTVKSHVASIYTKLGVSTRSEAVAATLPTSTGSATLRS